METTERKKLSNADREIARMFLSHLGAAADEGIPDSFAGSPEMYLQADIESAFMHSDDMDVAEKAILGILNENEIPLRTSSVIVYAARRSAGIRKDWGEALRFVKRGELLSRAIGYGFTRDDIATLAKLHKANRFRKKIEALLTDCNFHTESADFAAGRYDKYIQDKD